MTERLLFDPKMSSFEKAYQSQRLTQISLMFRFSQSVLRFYLFISKFAADVFIQLEYNIFIITNIKVFHTLFIKNIDILSLYFSGLTLNTHFK